MQRILRPSNYKNQGDVYAFEREIGGVEGGRAMQDVCTHMHTREAQWTTPAFRPAGPQRSMQGPMTLSELRATTYVWRNRRKLQAGSLVRHSSAQGNTGRKQCWTRETVNTGLQIIAADV